MELNQKSFKGENLRNRFWDKVNLWFGIADEDCWNWVAAKTFGYGRLNVNKRSRLAHHLSWIMYKSEIPEEMNVLHKCDNRACVNPSHLFLGTLKDNNQDCNNKQRNYCKLTSEQVKEIRTRLKDCNQSQSELAREYKVSNTMITDIKLNKWWKHEMHHA